MDKETKKLDEITEGLLHPTEPPVLYKLGSKCTGRGVILEISSWKGRSTILLTRGCVYGDSSRTFEPEVYAVDTFEHTDAQTDFGMSTFDDFKSNIKRAGVSKYIIPLIGRSEEVVKDLNKPIEILFIDGSHDYKSVLMDIDNWCPKLIKRGWVAFHDSDYKGVIKAFKERILNSGQYSNLGFEGSLLYAQKIPGSMFKKRLVMLKREILVVLWKHLPEFIKVPIRILLGKQYNSAPIKEVPHEYGLYEKVEKSKKRRAKLKKKSYWTPV